LSDIILERNLLRVYRLRPGEQLRAFSLFEVDPMSESYRLPSWFIKGKLNAWALSRWLAEVHERRGWLPSLPEEANRKHAAELLREGVSEEVLIRAVHLASQLANHPFSFKFVRKILDRSGDSL